MLHNSFGHCHSLSSRAIDFYDWFRLEWRKCQQLKKSKFIENSVESTVVYIYKIITQFMSIIFRYEITRRWWFEWVNQWNEKQKERRRNDTTIKATAHQQHQHHEWLNKSRLFVHTPVYMSSGYREYSEYNAFVSIYSVYEQNNRNVYNFLNKHWSKTNKIAEKNKCATNERKKIKETTDGFTIFGYSLKIH